MTLAGLLAYHKQELICDLAEFYSIYDYRSVPVFLLATLAAGLRDESRIGMLRNKVKGSPEMIMLIRIYDVLMGLFAAKGNPGPLLYDFLIREDTDKDGRPQSFQTGDEMMRRWNKLRGQYNE